ncbi:MAG: ABC transporter ATP-binding protein [Planctomycetes bacterium]|nr:ABC transporter ATP-binding protein [Planctomycetota bacterium]
MSAPSIISLRNLTMGYGDKPVLRGIDLDVEPGCVLGYIGPNGAGKTTTVKILIGMLSGFGGQASVCGYDVAAQPLEVKRRIGYVPESAALYEALTPVEYLRFIGRLYDLTDAETNRRAGAFSAALGGLHYLLTGLPLLVPLMIPVVLLVAAALYLVYARIPWTALEQ